MGLIGEDNRGFSPAPSCPEPAVCVSESPSLRQQEPYSVPLLGGKKEEIKKGKRHIIEIRSSRGAFRNPGYAWFTSTLVPKPGLVR